MMNCPSEARQPQSALQLAKSAALHRLHAAVVEAHNRTSIAELGFLRRALFYLRNDRDDRFTHGFAHGYTKAIQETLRDTEQDEFRGRLWFRITYRAIFVCHLTTLDSAGTEAEIAEIIADLGRLG
jgi:hypothetical protein